MIPVPYHRPTTAEEAWSLASSLPDARYLAGGTDLLVRMKDGAARPGAFISLRGIPELSRVRVGPEGAVLGGTAPIARLLDDDRLRRGWPALAEALREIGSVQVRESATLGGNLCNASPCADSGPPLLVYEARVRLVGPGGERRMPLAEFLVSRGVTRLQPGEILAAVELGAPEPAVRATFLKQKRVAMDIALTSVAAALRVEEGVCREVRLAAGSVAPVPLRLRGAEDVLAGREPTPERLAEAGRVAAEEVRPVSDIRASADYRRTLVDVLVRRSIGRLLDAAGRPG